MLLSASPVSSYQMIGKIKLFHVFHVEAVKDKELFIEARDKYIAPSLDAKTGVYKCGPAVAGGDKQSRTSTKMAMKCCSYKPHS